MQVQKKIFKIYTDLFKFMDAVSSVVYVFPRDGGSQKNISTWALFVILEIYDSMKGKTGYLSKSFNWYFVDAVYVFRWSGYEPQLRHFINLFTILLSNWNLKYFWMQIDFC